MKTAPVFEFPTIRLEMSDGKITITPNKPGSRTPVIIDAKRLQQWAEKLYREGVLA